MAKLVNFLYSLLTYAVANAHTVVLPGVIPHTTISPLSPDAYDSSVIVDATESELVFDLMNPTNNQEIGTEIDGVEVLVQIVPNAMAVTYYNLVPCGVVYPHLHPNADALTYILESNPDVEIGYLAPNGTAIIITNLEQGNTFTAAANLVQWAINKSCFESFKGIQFFNNPNIADVRPDIQVGSIPAEILQV